MELTRLEIDESVIQQIALGPFAHHVQGLANRVQNEAIQGASGRPGPRIRSGELVEQIRQDPGRDADGSFIDIGSGARSPRQDYDYPSALETGKGGVRYEWLRPAFRRVFPGA